MKDYFAKYLPVEGEIKEGVYYKSKKYPHLKAKVATANWSKQILDFYDVQKVKLFLCSRDIQVGDKVFIIGHTLQEPLKIISIKNGMVSFDTTYYIILDQPVQDCFKVIGEISPDATWVKEGDTFDEGEITFIYINKHFPDEQAEFDNSSEFLANEYYHRNRDKFKMIVKVKCSQCNTYH